MLWSIKRDNNKKEVWTYINIFLKDTQMSLLEYILIQKKQEDKLQLGKPAYVCILFLWATQKG